MLHVIVTGGCVHHADEGHSRWSAWRWTASTKQVISFREDQTKSAASKPVRMRISGSVYVLNVNVFVFLCACYVLTFW